MGTMSKHLPMDESVKLYKLLTEEMKRKITFYTKDLENYKGLNVHTLFHGWSNLRKSNLRFIPVTDRYMEDLSMYLKRVAKSLKDTKDINLSEEFIEVYREHGFVDISTISEILDDADRVTKRYVEINRDFVDLVENWLPNHGIIVTDDLTLYGKDSDTESVAYQFILDEDEEMAELSKEAILNALDALNW